MASASAQLGIAKASLLAALLKPDAGLPSCSRDDIEQFHGLLSAAVAQCSPTNVQKCKQWSLQHLVPSPARVAALGRYLVAFANSLGLQQQQQQQQAAAAGPKKAPGPSVKRKRLHILYVLNDVIFHLKFRTQNQTFPGEIESHLPALFRSAAAFANAPKHERKLKDLIQLWEEKSYFAGPVLEKLRAAVAEGPSAKDKEANGAGVTQKKATTASSAREAPFTLPSMHGDASTPWYDLPAANWLPVIEPNSTRPMNPSMIKPLQLAGGPADKNLVDAVKKLLGDVDKIYAKDTRLDRDLLVDIGQMGEMIERDELGDIVGGETYYGWSRAFCEKMRARRRGGDAMEIDDGGRGRRGASCSSSRTRSRSRSRGRSSSRDSPHPAAKRRRISGSRGRSMSRDESRGGLGRRGRSWDSKSRSRSRGGRSYSRRHSRSYSRSPRRGRYSPPPVPASNNGAMPGNGRPNNFVPPIPQQFNQLAPPQPPFQPNWPVPPPPPPHQQQQYPPPQPGGFDGWNVPPPPPPPPPQYHGHGHWPPPPPLGSNIAGQPPQGWFPPNASGSPVPAPPPPPPPSSWGGAWGPPPPPSSGPPPQPGGGGFHQGGGGFQYGRGGNGNYRGRGGGYARGRGW